MQYVPRPPFLRTADTHSFAFKETRELNLTSNCNLRTLWLNEIALESGAWVLRVLAQAQAVARDVHTVVLHVVYSGVTSNGLPESLDLNVFNWGALCNLLGRFSELRRVCVRWQGDWWHSVSMDSTFIPGIVERLAGLEGIQCVVEELQPEMRFGHNMYSRVYDRR